MLRRLLVLIAFSNIFRIGLTSPHNICKNWRKQAKPSCDRVFVWDADVSNFISPFNVTLLSNYVHNSASIRSKSVRVIADNMLPYITSSNYSQALGGFLGDVWHLIENTLGFTSNVSSVYYDTGLEMITAGGADVMLAAVVRKEGLLNVKYSQPYFYNWYQMFSKMPQAKASSSSYLKTFDAQLWLVTLGTFAALTLTLWTSTKFLNSLRGLRRTISAPSCFLGIVSGFINQGFDLKLSSYSGRMQVMFALILGVVLYSAMNAVLVAQLAVFDIPFPFKSLDDIADRRTHSLCLRSNSFVYNNFTDKNRLVLGRWRGVLNGPNCEDITFQEKLAAILCEEDVVILENRAVMDMILKNYDLPCQIISREERLFQAGNSFLFYKGFVHEELIGIMMQRMRSTGILKRLEYMWIRREKLLNSNQLRSPQINLDHVGGVLLMYSVMILISLLVLAFEVFCARCTHSRIHCLHKAGFLF